MATAPATSGPQPINPTTSSAATSSTQPSQTPAQVKQSHFDLAISLILHTWPALTTAVQNSWGGPDSAGKRDWFAGAISDLFISAPDTDQEDLECVLLQVMEDEFEVRLEDETEVEVAREILRMRRHCERGNFGEIEGMRRRWEERRGKAAPMMKMAEAPEQEVDEESENEDEEGGVDVDVEMADAVPQLVEAREKPQPEVDEEGFTKVATKKRR